MAIPVRLKASFYWLVAHSGITWVVRQTLQRHGATIVCYHDPSPEALRAHIEFLAQRYNLVPVRQIIDWLYDRSCELPPRALAITLDDGWVGNLRLERLLTESGIMPTVFVCTQIVGTHRRFWFQTVPDGAEKDELKRLPDAVRVERLASQGFVELDEFRGEPSAVDLEQLRAMRAWADVQSHTRLHPILPMCGDERARDEIAGSRADLEHALDGHEVYALAYPNGDYTQRDAQMAREAGYRCALTIDPGFVARGDDPFTLPRVRLTDDAGRDELAVRLSGVHAFTRRVAQVFGLVSDRT